MAYGKHEKLRTLGNHGRDFLSKGVGRLPRLFSEARYEVQKEDSSLLLQSSKVHNVKKFVSQVDHYPLNLALNDSGLFRKTNLSSEKMSYQYKGHSEYHIFYFV